MERFLLLDSNLPILLSVGLADRGYVARHRRLRAYDSIDFDLLAGLIARSKGFLLSPNVVTEASNLIRQAAEPIRSAAARMLAKIVGQGDERLVPSKVAVQNPEYLRLGVADTVLLEIASVGVTLLTADLQLYLAACRSGLKALNFNHLRNERTDFNAVQ